ncbi:efflux RND transporter periplasmic adaptor subunit [Chloroflexota bacterium]
MRVLKIVLMILVMGSLGLMPLSCGSESESETIAENQAVSVQRGNLTIDITASGNLALSVTEDLAFEIEGTVEEILVEEGDSVNEEQLLAKLDTSEWDKELTTLVHSLLQAEISLDNAELTLEKAEENTYLTSTGDIRQQYTDPREIDIKELQQKLAEARYDNAKEALEKSLEAKPEIIAPFDGFITKVLVDGGEEVKRGTIAVTIADPNKFEADIMVSELDIFQIKLGSEGYVQVDAMSGISLPAKVVHISPTATIQQGVVNYRVKVEVQPLEAMVQGRQQARQSMRPDISSGELPERLKQAIEEGRITQEQAEEIMKRGQQDQGGQQRQAPAVIPEDFQLRQGLTAIVSIIVDQRNDVLLVPNGAIATQGQQTYVQVMSPDGTIEERSIMVGISDYQNTEVINGLNEGEEVVVPQGTSATTTTTQQGPPGGIRIPGMVRPR